MLGGRFSQYNGGLVFGPLHVCIRGISELFRNADDSSENVGKADSFSAFARILLDANTSTNKVAAEDACMRIGWSLGDFFWGETGRGMYYFSGKR